MASCELCGKEKVSTKKARTAGIQVDACIRCIESMNLQVVEAPVNFSKIKRPRVNTVTSRGVAGKDIMAKKEVLDQQIDDEINKAEKEIEALRVSAPVKINKIAIETSSELLEKLIGSGVNSSSISAIVDDLSKRNGDKYYGN